MESVAGTNHLVVLHATLQLLLDECWGPLITCWRCCQAFVHIFRSPGQVPIMLRSDYCNLSNQSERALCDLGECPYDQVMPQAGCLGACGVAPMRVCRSPLTIAGHALAGSPCTYLPLRCGLSFMMSVPCALLILHTAFLLGRADILSSMARRRC